MVGVRVVEAATTLVEVMVEVVTAAVTAVVAMAVALVEVRVVEVMVVAKAAAVEGIKVGWSASGVHSLQAVPAGEAVGATAESGVEGGRAGRVEQVVQAG